MISGLWEGPEAIRRLARGNAAPPAARAIGLLPAAIPTGRATINEHDGKALLAAAGLPVTQEVLATTRDEAAAAFAAIGGPVVLKVASDAIPHKSDHGLVELGIASLAALDAAWGRVEANIATLPGRPEVAGILVQEMVRDGIEVFIGVTTDAEYGPVLAFGLGGVLVEILRDVALRPLPLREGDAAAMIAETAVAAKILAGVRGKPPADIAALVRAIEAVADFAWVNRAHIAEIDVNPVKVMDHGKGCIAVDAVIVPRRPPDDLHATSQ
jgi:succinyl-CoA synthetase beta subunit